MKPQGPLGVVLTAVLWVTACQRGTLLAKKTSVETSPPGPQVAAIVPDPAAVAAQAAARERAIERLSRQLSGRSDASRLQPLGRRIEELARSMERQGRLPRARFLWTTLAALAPGPRHREQVRRLEQAAARSPWPVQPGALTPLFSWTEWWVGAWPSAAGMVRATSQRGYHTVWNGRGEPALIFGEKKALLAVSPAGRLGVLYSDGQLQLVDLDTGRRLSSWSSGGGKPTEAAMSSSGLLAAVTGGKVQIWEPRTGELRHRLDQVQAQASGPLVFGPRGRLLVFCGAGHAIVVFDLQQRRVRHRLVGHTAYVVALALSADGRRLASGGFDKRVMLWETAGGKQVRVLPGHGGAVYALAFSPDGRRLAAGGASPWPRPGRKGTVIQQWALTTGKQVAAYHHPEKIAELAYRTRAGHQLLEAVGQAGTLKTYDLQRGACTHTSSLRGFDEVRYLGHARQGRGRRISLIRSDGKVEIWDVARGRVASTGLLYGRAKPSALAMSPDHARSRLLVGYESGDLVIWDPRRGTPAQLRAFPGARPGSSRAGSRPEHRGDPVSQVAFQPGGDLVAASHWDARETSLKLWDSKSGQLYHAFEKSFCSVGPYAFSSDGRLLAVSGSSTSIQILDVSKKKVLLTLDGSRHDPNEYHEEHEECVFYSDLSWHPGGRYLAAAFEGMVQLWDLKQRKAVRIYRVTTEGRSDPSFVSVSFSADGRLLAGGAEDRSIHLWRWQAASHEARFKLAGDDDTGGVRAIRFIGQRQLLVLGYPNSDAGAFTAWLLDHRDGRQLLTYRAGNTGLWLAATPDGHVDANDARRRIKWRHGQRIYPWRAGWSRYHIPGLARRVLGGDEAFRFRALRRLLKLRRQQP